MNRTHFNKDFQRLGIALIALCLPLFVRAQLVDDGDTNVLSGVTSNINQTVTVGTNGSFTLLMLTNGSALTNNNFGLTIGFNSSAQSNRVIVSGSQWSGIATNTVGSAGSGNELDILNGGAVSNSSGYIGFYPSASNNVALVSGSGSTWNGLNAVGFQGSFNTLIVSNGGTVISTNYAYIGGGSSSLGNSAIITGSGSLWTCSSLLVGTNGPGLNQLTVNNGARVTSIWNVGGYSNSNLLTVADPGSSFSGDIFIGSGTNNQCVVSNGAKLTSYYDQIDGTFTREIVTGPGSVWTNPIPADVYLGQYSNVLSITDGGVMVAGAVYFQGSNDEAIISGPNSLCTNDEFGIGASSSQLFITNGGALRSTQTYFSYRGSNCFALVAGPGSLWTNRFILILGEETGSNLLFVTDSGKLTAPQIWVGEGASGNQLIVSNSGFVQAGTLGIGLISSTDCNSVTLAGGTIVTTGTLVYGIGTLVINSGQMNTTGLGVDSSANVIFNSGILQLGSASWSNNTTPFTIGDGTDAATLQIWNGGNCLFGGGLIISSNALLSGSGTITANISVNNGGTIAPGTINLGTIVDNGALILNPGSTTLMKLNASATTSDTLTGMSNLLYGGTLQLTNVSGSYSSGQSFSLFAATNYSGAFAALSPAAPGPGLRWDTYALGISGVLRVFSTPTPMPSIGSITTTGGNLLISASGGIPYDPCYLLTSTNLAAPISNWSCITTNYFDSTGATTFTNAMPADQTQQYFLLQVN